MYSKGVVVLVLEYRNLNAIPVNDGVVVLTKKDGQGWYLRKDEVIKFSYKDLFLDNVTELAVGLLKNDIFRFGQQQSLKTTCCHLIIPEDGLYHLCILTKY